MWKKIGDKVQTVDFSYGFIRTNRNMKTEHIGDMTVYYICADNLDPQPKYVKEVTEDQIG